MTTVVPISWARGPASMPLGLVGTIALAIRVHRSSTHFIAIVTTASATHAVAAVAHSLLLLWLMMRYPGRIVIASFPRASVFHGPQRW